MATVADNLREAIQRRGESISSLAVKASVSRATIYKILSGEVQSTTSNTVRKLAVALNVKVDYLLGGETLEGELIEQVPLYQIHWRGDHLELRIDKDEKLRLWQEAEQRGLTLSEYLVTKIQTT